MDSTPSLHTQISSRQSATTFNLDEKRIREVVVVVTAELNSLQKTTLLSLVFTSTETVDFGFLNMCVPSSICVVFYNPETFVCLITLDRFFSSS